VRGVTFIQRIKTPFTEGPVEEQIPYQPGMRLIGELLQERREELGLDLHEIGAMLRIKPGYLAALEQGRSHDLPGPAYAIGFVRAYADFLGLDAEHVLRRFKAEAAGVTARPDLALPVPLGERSLPGGALVLVALILGLCGYGFWYYLSTEERDRPQRVASVPTRLQPPPSNPVLMSPRQSDVGAANGANNPAPTLPNQPAAAATTPQVATPQSSPPMPAPALPSTPAAAGPTTGSAAAKAPNQGAPADSSSHAAASAQTAPPSGALQPAAPPAAAAANPAAAARIAIRALADCWIQVRAADQSIVFSRVLKAGEIYGVPVRSGLSLRTGNAGALEIAVDGKTVPSIGGIGTLRRSVALDPTELTAGTAVHG
jgi:cytoskeleton protein RodZ